MAEYRCPHCGAMMEEEGRSCIFGICVVLFFPFGLLLFLLPPRYVCPACRTAARL